MKMLVRTQISLPQDLKTKINRQARIHDISMAEYLRRAALAYEKYAKLKQTLRSKIANELRGSFKRHKTGWGAMSIKQVNSWIRKERKASDARLN